MNPQFYLNVLGLHRHPFPVAPDEEHFYVSDHIDQVVTELVHGIQARKGFMVLGGEVGLGKTTLTRRILSLLAAHQVRTSLVFHTSLKDVDLLREINRDFGLPENNRRHGLGDELQRLFRYLIAQYRAGNNCAIIIDDAQNLDRSSLELVRMISNLEADRRKLVQILLVGQHELLETLNRSELRQLRSRVAIAKSVRPLAKEEMRAYVHYKLNMAGNQGRLRLARNALTPLYRCTKGNFRQLNMLMDRCLYALCRDRTQVIDRHIVRAARADMQPRTRRFCTRAPALAATMLLPLLLGAAAGALHLHAGHSAAADDNRPAHYYKVPPFAEGGATTVIAGQPEEHKWP